MRAQYHISGNMAEDFFASLLMYPCVVVQMHDHIEKTELLKKNDTNNASAVANRTGYL